MVAPRCPWCNAGINTMAANRYHSFLLIYCGQCGAIFGVIPVARATVKTPEKTAPGAGSKPQSPARKQKPAAPETQKPEKQMTPAQAAAMYRQTGGTLYFRIAGDLSDEEGDK